MGAGVKSRPPASNSKATWGANMANAEKYAYFSIPPESKPSKNGLKHVVSLSPGGLVARRL